MGKNKQFLALFVFLIICYAAAGFGSLFTTPAIPAWYQMLPKPAWTPPSWVFGPVWTLLYTMMAFAAWLVWRRRGVQGVVIPLMLFSIQLALNVVWSVLFFGMRRPDLGLFDIILLWVAILATTVAFWRVSWVAGALLVPYLLWVSFATALNYAIVRNLG